MTDGDFWTDAIGFQTFLTVVLWIGLLYITYVTYYKKSKTFKQFITMSDVWLVIALFICFLWTTVVALVAAYFKATDSELEDIQDKWDNIRFM